jgi:hypothetical protein
MNLGPFTLPSGMTVTVTLVNAPNHLGQRLVEFVDAEDVPGFFWVSDTDEIISTSGRYRVV